MLREEIRFNREEREGRRRGGERGKQKVERERRRKETKKSNVDAYQPRTRK